LILTQGGALGHLGIIISVATHATVRAENPWANPAPPGRYPEDIAAGTASKSSAAGHIWEENVNTLRTYCTVDQALKQQIITVFEPMYLDIFNDDMVGFANTSTREMLDHLFLTYGSIMTVDLEHKFENMRKAWDPQQPVETLFEQIQYCVDYVEAGGVTICPAREIIVAYTKIFATGSFMSDAADGMKKRTQIKPGPISKFTLPRRTVNTSKYKVNLLPTLVTMLPMQMWNKLKTKWLMPQLEHYKIWQEQQRWAVA
jgi:hypothetical protein